METLALTYPLQLAGDPAGLGTGNGTSSPRPLRRNIEDSHDGSSGMQPLPPRRPPPRGSPAHLPRTEHRPTMTIQAQDILAKHRWSKTSRTTTTGSSACRLFLQRRLPPRRQFQPIQLGEGTGLRGGEPSAQPSALRSGHCRADGQLAGETLSAGALLDDQTGGLGIGEL